MSLISISNITHCGLIN